MPVPKPSSEEKEAEFISRCMSSKKMVDEYPDQKQRTSICYDSWRKNKGEKMEDNNKESIISKEETIKKDDQGRKIIAENVHLLFTGTIEGEDEE